MYNHAGCQDTHRKPSHREPEPPHHQLPSGPREMLGPTSKNLFSHSFTHTSRSTFSRLAIKISQKPHAVSPSLLLHALQNLVAYTRKSSTMRRFLVINRVFSGLLDVYRKRGNERCDESRAATKRAVRESDRKNIGFLRSDVGSDRKNIGFLRSDCNAPLVAPNFSDFPHTGVKIRRFS